MDPNGTTYAAVFIDFENVYYHLRKRLFNEERTQDVIIDLIRSLREFIQDKRNESCIIQHAYADFEQLEVNAMGPLYLMGVETHNVLGTEHKNAADMRLCIDCLEILYTRPEIGTFIFVAGDRDYIPVIQHLKKRAKMVLAVAFKDNISGDLLMNVGEKGYVDANELLTHVVRAELEVGEERMKEQKYLARQEVKVEAPKSVYRAEQPVKVAEPVFSRATPISERNALEALEILLMNYGDKTEVWFTPFLNKLRQLMQHLAEYERKAIITTLEDFGAVKIEKRLGDPHDYSVLIINWNHPDVKTLNPGTT